MLSSVDPYLQTIQIAYAAEVVDVEHGVGVVIEVVQEIAVDDA
jgi:hypothetical protein